MKTAATELLEFVGDHRFATVLADPPWQFTNPREIISVGGAGLVEERASFNNSGSAGSWMPRKNSLSAIAATAGGRFVKRLFIAPFAGGPRSTILCCCQRMARSKCRSSLSRLGPTDGSNSCQSCSTKSRWSRIALGKGLNPCAA